MIQMKNLKVYCTYYTSDLYVFISVCVRKYCDAIFYLNISFYLIGKILTVLLSTDNHLV